MRIAVIGSLLLISLLLGLSAAPAAMAQQLSVKPGGTYVIYVKVHKPASLKLLEDDWEVRVYFYSGTDCYNTGYWWQSGSDWIYSGWYAHRYIGDDWAAGPEDRTFNITVNLVNNPRPQDDIDHGMGNMPVPGYVSIRARLVIQDIKAELTSIGDSETGYATFTIGGMSYKYQYIEDQYGDINISGEDFEARIDQDFAGEYRLIIDQTTSVSVSDDASSTGVYTMPLAINLNLTSTTHLEPSIELSLELKIVIGVVVTVAVAAAVAYLALRGRSTEEPPPL